MAVLLSFRFGLLNGYTFFYSLKSKIIFKALYNLAIIYETSLTNYHMFQQPKLYHFLNKPCHSFLTPRPLHILFLLTCERISIENETVSYEMENLIPISSEKWKQNLRTQRLISCKNLTYRKPKLIPWPISVPRTSLHPQSSGLATWNVAKLPFLCNPCPKIDTASNPHL